MRPTVLASALALLPLVASAEAPLVRIGQTVEGQLTAEDAPTSDQGVSRDYRVEAKAGQFLIVSVKSSDFDAKVTVFNPDRSQAIENDDRADGNFDPLAVAETKVDGVYRIRVASLGSGEEGKVFGRFTMKVVAFSGE